MAKAGARIVVVVAALLIAPSSVCAAVFTWNGNGGSPDPAVPAGGSGTWDAGVAANWWNGTTNVVWPATSSLDDDAVFAGTAGTVTIAGGVAANSLTFSTTGYTLTGGTLTLDGVAPTITTNASVTATIGSSMLGTAGLIKSGSGTLTLSGLSSTAGSNYSGNTIIGAGTLGISSDAALSGGLTFGSSAGSTTVGTLDLSNASATFGALTVRTNTTANNTITIGAGETLTTLGNVAISYGLSSPASGDTRLVISGAGGWLVNNSGGTIVIGGGANGGRTRGILNLGGLGTFNANLGSTGDVRVGDASITTSGFACTLTLATTSTISAGRIAVGRSDDNGAKTLNLGSGEQRLNVTTLAVGGDQSGTFPANGSNTVQFSGSTGTLFVRGADGVSASNLYVGFNASSLGSSIINTFDVRGHAADIVLTDLSVGRRQGGTNSQTANFRFDTGSLSVANQAIFARSTVGAANTANIILGSALAVGSGTAVFTNGILLGSNSATAAGATATATLTISSNPGFSFNVISGAIVMGQKSGANAANISATLNLNGGSLTMTGDIVSGTQTQGQGGTMTRTFNLAGGVLDMGGRSFGNSGTSGSITLNFQSGTLRNVLEINDGAGLTKTTTGTLTLDGTNSYGGTTTVSDGVLVLASGSSVVATGSVSVADVAGATLRLGVNKTIGSLAGGGSTGGAVDLQSSTLTTGDATDTTFAGIIGGAGGLVKQGGGRFTLTGTNTYAGATAVNAGILTIGGTGSINATSGINVAVGGQLNYNAATALAVSPVLQGNGASSRAVLSGTGGIGVAVTLDDLGDVLAPGNSPGILPFSTSQSWSAYTYDFEVLNWSGTTAGTDFDQIQIADLLTLSTSGTYLLNITGTVAGYTDTDRTWTILTTGSGVGGFDPSKWAISTAGLTGVSGSSSRQFSVQQTGNTIELVYAVPEPATLALAAGGIAVMALALRRRRAA